MRKKLHLILLVLFTAFNASHAQISGFAFRDFNADGVKSSNETIGIQGVKVFLYANNGALIDSVVTTSTGQYSFVVAPSSNKLKIQFDKLSFPLNAKESFFGVNNGTDIQFVTAPNTAVNIGLNLEGDYCGQNPKIVTPIFIDGASGTNTTGLNDALYSLNYSNYGAKTTEATRAETGSVWGVAYSKKTKQLYSASFLKRHVGLKDGKLGQIFVTDIATSGSPTTVWLDVSTLGLAGNWQYDLDAQRGLGNAGTPSKDSMAFSQIAATGLGDIDVSEDETKLYAMDLINKQLLVIDIATKTLVGAYPVPSVCNGTAGPSYYCAYPKTFTSTDGKLWKNGHYFNTDNNGASYTQTISNPNNVTDGTNDATLYNPSIYSGNGAGNFLNYQFPLGNGTYSVKLHLATNGLPNNTNFNVISEGTTVFSNVNVYTEAGNALNKAITKTFAATVTDGVLDIKLAGNAGTLVLISGFEITPTSSQASGQTRPFAIKSYKGKVYVGSICDASGSQAMSDLNAGIFQFDPQTNTFNSVPVLTVPLNYTKGPTVILGVASAQKWFPWTSVYPNNTTGGIATAAGGFDVYNQPVLSDIEFDLDGSMLLGFFDRWGHQMGAVANYKPNGQGSQNAAVGGDLLRAYFNGSSYELENNAKEGVSSTKAATAGFNNNQGPGGGEFYFGDHLGGNASGAGSATGHYEILMGGLAFLPGSGEIRATVGDALAFSSGALASFNNITGDKQNSFTIYTGVTGGVQQKSNGLGDLELLCNEAPIQIGNYVWVDLNNDGIQDPNEPPVTNVVVSLWKNGTQIASTPTNAKGEYYFSSKSILGASWTGTGADTTLLPNTAYEVKIDFNTYGGYALTATNSTNNNGNDQTDNDASLTGNQATIAFTTGDFGTINHSYDFGLLCTGVITIASTYNAATCPTTGITANNNASIQITTSGDKVAISTTGIPTTLYTAANTVTAGSYTFTTQNGAADSFYVRVWNGPVCYKDTLIIVNPIRCCPTINAISTPANYVQYCSSTVIPALNVTTNAIATDSIRIVSFSAKQTNASVIYAGTLLATKVITGVAATVSNTANFTNIALPTNISSSNDTLWIYAIYIDKTGDTTCKVFVEKPVIIKPEPTALISGFTTVCNGSTVTLASHNATSYKWGKLPSATTLATTKTYTPTPTPNAANTYWLVTTNSGTCASDTAFHTVTASEGIQGTAFRDFNSDGIINSNETVGFANIKVRLFDSVGVVMDSTTTDNYGRYAFPNATASMGKLRLEFDKTTFPAHTQESFSGNNNGTDIQFITPPNCSVNIGLKETRDFCGTNPKIVSPIFIDGSSATNTTGLNEALYSLNYSNYSAKTTEATRTEIGATWGVGYSKKDKKIYTAAFLKRHVGLKDGKLGQIYVTDMAAVGSPTTAWLDVSTLGIAGNWQFALDAARGLGNAGTPSKDSLAFSQVAATGLGDIDVSEDETQLYAMDLINKQLLVIDIATKTLVGAYPVPSICTGSATPSYYAANAQTFTATDGKLWKNGYYFNTDNGGLGYVQNITNPNNVLAGTTDAALYATSVYNTALNYQFPFGNGTYSVKLHVASNGFNNNTNFNIIAEGTTVFNNVNVVAEAGGINIGITKSFTTTVTDDVLNIKLASNPGNPNVLISGFEITPTSGQESGQTRPFAIKPYKGKVYVGAVCDASGSQDMSDLNGGIFEFNPQTNTFNSTPILSIPLNYAKGALVAPSNDPKRWFPWTNVYPNNTPSGISTGAGGFDIYNQPVLSDIEFDLDGSMIIGFFDRMGHQMAANVNNYKPNGQLSGYAAVAGDLLRAYFNGTNYELENNGKEGASSTKSATAGTNNIQGPGGGEFYFGDNTGGDASGAGNALGHYEILMGGLAFLPGSGEVRATAGDPLVFSSGGFSGFNNTTGDKQNGFTLYTVATGGVQYKSNGLGDLEILCELAPIQIGNYVWFDTDYDGIQDPNESPIPNILVTLWKGNTQIASTTTNSKGEYYFSENSVAGVTWTGTGADTSLLPNTSYSIKIQKNTQPFIDTLNLTTTNAAQQFATDQNDNDALLVGNFAQIDLITDDYGSVNHSYDFGFSPIIPFGSIGNYVWVDVNANGIQDEPAGNGINGIKIFLLNNANVIIDSVLTSNDGGGNPGYYLFDSLLSGTYTIKFPITQGGDGLTNSVITVATDGNSDANVTTGLSPAVVIDAAGTGTDKDNMTIDAGYKLPAQLGNYVWNDLNKDGVQNNSEVGVAGITVTLMDQANNVISSTITDAYGYYKFNPLDPGMYKVGFTLPANYVFTQQNALSNDSIDSDVDPISGRTANYTLVGGDSNMTVDAGIYFQQPTRASVGNYVWLDINQDGIQNNGEEGISGVTVTLYNSAGIPVSTMITNADGFYQFTNVVPGTYSVGFTPPVGLTFSPNNGNVSNPSNSDANPVTGMTNTFVVNAGDQLTYVDAGLYSLPVNVGSLGDKVWFDMNQNGIQDAEETGVGQVIVNLYEANGTTIIATTTTDAFGNYIFNNLPAGQYVVGFSNLPGGYAFSINTASDSTTNSDANPATGKTTIIQLGQGQYNMTIDAGIYSTVPTNTNSLGNFVWYDTDKDGIQDAGELGASGITVKLYDQANVELKSTSTNTDGFYLFTDLPNGDYHVGFSNLPLDYIFSSQSVGNNLSDSDPNVETGMTASVSLTGNTHNMNLDAGINSGNTRIGKATLGDLVWYDLNNDGFQDPQELGVPNVTVTLYEADGSTIVSSTITDALGNYIFTGLDAGDYVVGFTNLPIGFAISPKNSDSQGINGEENSDVNVATQKTDVITLGTGEDLMSVDMGITPPSGSASLGNFVWFDLNNDGLQTAGEPGVQGITVTLCDASGAPLKTTTTNAQGAYYFVGLIPDTYAVQFSNLPDGYSFTTQNIDGNGINGISNSDANPITGKSTTVTLSSGEDNPRLDAGIVSSLVASVGDFVWFDVNHDGIQDANETPIGGVLVTLFDNTNTPVASTITNPDGGYIFTNVIPSDYTIGFSNIPSGMEFTIQETNPTSNTGSNVNTATGVTPTFTVTAGTHNPSIDAGLYIPLLAGLGNYVWIDANENGLQEINELPVAGVVATLYAADGTTVLATAITDGSGAYSFVNLEPGTYIVGFSNLPNGSTRTQTIGSMNEPLNSDLQANGKTSPITLVEGEYNPNIDAGIYFGFTVGADKLQATLAVIENTSTCKVYWNTMDEINTKDFVIERSVNGIDFIEVGTAKASYQTQGTTNYNYSDDIEDVLNMRTIYYRVRLRDLDGRTMLSNVVYVNPVAESEVVMYPSPFTDRIVIEYYSTSQTSSEATVELVDASGRMIRKEMMPLKSGMNRITITSLDQLASGTYYVKFIDTDQLVNWVRKVLK